MHIGLCLNTLESLWFGFLGLCTLTCVPDFHGARLAYRIILLFINFSGEFCIYVDMVCRLGRGF